jgi:hypothetical protein
MWIEIERDGYTGRIKGAREKRKKSEGGRVQGMQGGNTGKIEGEENEEK